MIKNNMIKGYPKLISLTGGMLASCIQIGCSQLPGHMNPNRPSSSRASAASFNRGTQSSSMPSTSAGPAKLRSYTAEDIKRLGSIIMTFQDLEILKEFLKRFEESIIHDFISEPRAHTYIEGLST